MPVLPFQVSLYGGYTLALKRNLGHAAAQTTIDMMASDIWQGSLKSKNIVYRFEAKAGDLISISNHKPYKALATMSLHLHRM